MGPRWFRTGKDLGSEAVEAVFGELKVVFWRWVVVMAVDVAKVEEGSRQPSPFWSKRVGNWGARGR